MPLSPGMSRHLPPFWLPIMPLASPAPAVAAHPLLAGPLQRLLAVDGQQRVDVAGFLRHVHGVARWLPASANLVNLCEDRYHFLVLLCAAAVRGTVTLLPPSRAPQVVAELQSCHAGCPAIGDQPIAGLAGYTTLPLPLPQADGPMPVLPGSQVLLIGFTSGSTGKPSANSKTWGAFQASTAQNMAALQPLFGEAGLSVVATVPAQHMYGIEMSVMLPLLAPALVHAGRPFFAEDVACALAQVPPPRLLVTTPLHLDALLRSEVALPPLQAIVTATAPLPVALAVAAEQQLGCPVQEMFGSTETCIIASRRTAQEPYWSPLPGVCLAPQPDGTAVSAAHLPQPVVLADLVECLPDGRFQLRGRRADLLEIAGKRASLGDLTGRLLAIDGVEDAVMLQLPAEAGRRVGRIAALVVAPGLDEAGVLAALRPLMDPVFLPRPLRLVASLPRNETGKLPRDALLALLHANPG